MRSASRCTSVYWCRASCSSGTYFVVHQVVHTGQREARSCRQDVHRHVARRMLQFRRQPARRVLGADRAAHRVQRQLRPSPRPTRGRWPSRYLPERACSAIAKPSRLIGSTSGFSARVSSTASRSSSYGSPCAPSGRQHNRGTPARTSPRFDGACAPATSALCRSICWATCSRCLPFCAPASACRPAARRRCRAAACCRSPSLRGVMAALGHRVGHHGRQRLVCRQVHSQRRQICCWGRFGEQRPSSPDHAEQRQLRRDHRRHNQRVKPGPSISLSASDLADRPDLPPR